MYKSNVSTTFCLSKDLKVPFKLKIGNLQLKQVGEETLFVSIQLVSCNRPLTTPVTSFINNHVNTNKWIELPIFYSQIPVDTQLVVSLYNYDNTGRRHLVGDSVLTLFSNDYTLQKGYQRLHIRYQVPKDEEEQEEDKIIDKLEKKIKSHENGDIVPVDWLDSLSFRKIEQINRSTTTTSSYLSIELAQFDIPVVFSDVKYSIINIPTYVDSGNIQTSSVSISESSAIQNHTIFDPDQYRDFNNDDPIELKFRKLERIHQSSILDKEIRPTLKIRSKIFDILTKQFFEKLSSQEKNLIWKFRFYLLNNFMSNNSLQFNNFVINFIKCINWDDESEVNEFLNIINEVQTQHDKENLFIQELEIVDCLELLSYNYRNPIIRKLAIERLKLAKDEDLELYFLQLVQALKFENDDFNYNDNYDDDIEEEEDEDELATSTNTSDYAFIDSTELNNTEQSLLAMTLNTNRLVKLNSPLLNFLIERAINNSRLTSFFYWYVKVECDGERKRKKKTKQQQDDEDEEERAPTTEVDEGNLLVDNHEDFPTRNQQNHSSKFIRDDKIFSKTLNNFIVKLMNSSNGAMKLNKLSRQIEIFSKIHDISNKVKITYRREPVSKKVEILKKLLSEKDHKKKRHNTINSSSSITDTQETTSESLLQFDPIPLPLDPDIEICGAIPQESSVFKSSLSPLKITFKTSDGHKYPLMYKIGDDLRQDQFVIQIMTLIEKILLNENLDLRLKPYKILALGEYEGLIEFIPNESLSSILSTHQGSILRFLQENNPDPTNPLNVKLEVMDNYVRSCAGYCVVTYLLGVGDRHLDNLLLTRDGFFFHADFGYILGEDPKPFPPLMKLPIQIIEGMGGLDNENYKFFCNYCFITYITLRKNSNLILNLFQLMIDSNIPILQTINGDELEKFELILKIKEKFMLELNDEEAILHFQNLINDSVNAFLPVVIDRLHSFAQYWRA